jgi:hypothetical protein
MFKTTGPWRRGRLALRGVMERGNPGKNIVGLLRDFRGGRRHLFDRRVITAEQFSELKKKTTYL